MEYVTIPAFAEKVGVTAQAVYKRVKGDLAPYIKEEDGVKVISLEALDLYKPTVNTRRIQSLEEENTALKEELEALRKQIEALTREKVELLEKQAQLQDRLFTLVETQSKQQENFQVLLAQTQQLTTRLLETTTPKENELSNDEKEIDNNSPNVTKRGFWGWFNRK